MRKKIQPCYIQQPSNQLFRWDLFLKDLSSQITFISSNSMLVDKHSLTKFSKELIPLAKKNDFLIALILSWIKYSKMIIY